MSNFEFINHSCVILSHDNISLAMDPGLKGLYLIIHGICLLKTPNKSIETLKRSQFVWFSNEHPDHFNSPNLKIFSEKNNFLFQKTIGGKVVKFLKRISPNIKEINFKKTLQLFKNFVIEVIPFQYLDSMLIVKINNLTRYAGR